jgi:hypothetical protein
MPFSELMGTAMQDADEAAERYLTNLDSANEHKPQPVETTEKSVNA